MVRGKQGNKKRAQARKVKQNMKRVEGGGGGA